MSTDPGPSAVLLSGSRRNNFAGPSYCRAEMYAGRVAWWPTVSHGEYAGGTDGQTDRQTDGRQTVTVCDPLWTRPA